MDRIILSLAVSLWPSAAFWEGVEYLAEAVVIIAALFEVLADFEIILRGDDKRELRKRVAGLRRSRAFWEFRLVMAICASVRPR